MQSVVVPCKALIIVLSTAVFTLLSEVLLRGPPAIQFWCNFFPLSQLRIHKFIFFLTKLVAEKARGTYFARQRSKCYVEAFESEKVVARENQPLNVNVLALKLFCIADPEKRKSCAAALATSALLLFFAKRCDFSCSSFNFTYLPA